MARVVRWPLMAALVSGCFVDIGSGSGTTSATTTGDATSTATSPDSTSSGLNPDPTTLTSTTDPTPGSTTSNTCQSAGAPCSSNDAACCGCLTCENGTCTQGACEACHRCTDDGDCTPDEPGTACTGPDDLCPTLAFGFADGTCHAYAPAAATCDDTATCVPGPCTNKGAEHIKCPECQLPMPNCFAGIPLADIAITDVCQTTGTTAGCTPVCSNASALTLRSCNEAGACIAQDPIPCTPYACDLATITCKTECDTDIDCTIGYTCNFFGECQ